MRRIEFFYPGSDRRTQIAATIFEPEQPPRAVLQICHGMCEYVGRYAHFAGFMAENGYAVAGNDHLGHGKSVVSEEDLGYFDEREGHRHLIADAYSLTLNLKDRYPGLPVFLLGHSMGSAVARGYCSEYAAELAGAIFSGTPVQKLPRASGLAIGWQIRKYGARGISQLLVDMSLGSFNRRIKDPATPNDWLSRDPAIVETYNADPLCTFRFTASAYRDLLHLVSVAMSPKWPQTLPADFPVLMISGEMDPCGDYGRGVKTVFSHMQKRGMTDIALRLYPGARHEVLNEINKDEVYQDVLTWCDRVLRQ